MESYTYKQKPNYLPKLNRTNSTWYKTFNLDKKKSNSMKTLNANNLSNYKNNKKKINLKHIIHRNNSNNLKISKKTARTKLYKKTRPFSVLQSRISEAETDDSIFALSQIRNIDHLISKRINKNLVWKEKQKKIYDIKTSRNSKEIKNIKRKIYEARFEPSKNFDLKNEIDKKKYFPIEKVEIINEASNILKKMENQINEKKINKFYIKKRVDLQTFARQNREICLKNNIINLLKSESNKLLIKEKEISDALESANVSFNRDKQLFEEFIYKHKEKAKQNELIIEEAIKNNKRLIDEIHKLQCEIKSKHDEIERIIRDISVYYSYAEFIHRIIGNGQNLKKVNIDKLNIYQNRNQGRDINNLLNNVFKEFDFLLNNNHISTNAYDFNLNAEQMTYLFNSMETSIINDLDERDSLIKEIEIIKEKNKSELNFLHNRIVNQENELNFLIKEKNKIINLYQPLNDESKKILNLTQKYIFEINEELNKIKYIDEESKDDTINSNMEATSKETFNLLHRLEDKLIFLMNEMEKIDGSEKEPDDLFKNILENVKTENKNRKYKQSRMILEKLEEEKKLKYQQRANRIKIRSAIEFPPPWAQKLNKQRKKQKKPEGNTDEELLYY